MRAVHWVTRRSVESLGGRRMLVCVPGGTSWGLNMKRYLLGGLLGGLVMFFWGFLAHTVLPLGEIGMGQPTDEKAVLDAVQSGLPAQEGVYFLPWMDSAKMSDEAAMAEYATRTKASPYALVIYQPIGRDATDMGAQLGVQWAGDTIAAILLAWLIAAVGTSMARAVTVASVASVFGWLGSLGPFVNWYRFPLDFALANLAEQWIGWVLAALVIGWWMRR